MAGKEKNGIVSSVNDAHYKLARFLFRGSMLTAGVKGITLESPVEATRPGDVGFPADQLGTPSLDAMGKFVLVDITTISLATELHNMSQAHPNLWVRQPGSSELKAQVQKEFQVVINKRSTSPF